MKISKRAKGEFTGRHMFFIMLAFFGTIITVNLTMATFANRSWTGLVVKNSYVASQQFNDKAALARAQDALGWRGELTISDGTVGYRLTDRSGDPVSVEAVRMIFRRPVSEQGDRALALARAGTGVFAAAIEIADGGWIVEILSDVGQADPYRQVERVRVAGGEIR
ncbi:cytochrome oxidase [Nitratireductor sp. CAU 1489]|uniref:Cytochrome oxidase n=1 Tax=Nitratireductor arenosus TaxID=2682096 RepID=A0A844QDU9_9HYPH|nr:FixH family protein [Nitratireductor arenosus]MVA97435.1 cytochrome oxidase [Nitratireductor arenosus]